jgi:threonine dehydrogenase-like Zn-dependent dehydrogenase
MAERHCRRGTFDADAVVMTSMRAAVFEQKGKISIREVPRPSPGPGEALIRVTLTTICGTDVHILRGAYKLDQIEEAYELFGQST